MKIIQIVIQDDQDAREIYALIKEMLHKADVVADSACLSMAEDTPLLVSEAPRRVSEADTPLRVSEAEEVPSGHEN